MRRAVGECSHDALFLRKYEFRYHARHYRTALTSPALRLTSQCEETWKEVFQAKRLVTFQGFDEIFGHVLGDPDEHFGLFTGDDVKKRARAKALALAQLRKMHGGDSFTTGAPDKRRRTRSGSQRGSVMSSGGMSMSGPTSMGMGAGRGSSMAMIAMNVANITNITKGKTNRQSASQIEKYKAGAMIDVYEVFSILAMLCNNDVETKLSFIFVLFATNSSKPGGMDAKQFVDMVDRITIGTYKLFGFAPPPKQFTELATIALFGKKTQPIREVWTFKECWDWCQDEVEVANYLQKVLNFSLTPSSMYKQEANVNTDSYLQNSKLMEGDSDEEDENASGISKHRPKLWVELVKKLCSKKWWDHLEQLQSKSLLLPAVKTMHDHDRLALPVFEGKVYKGLLDCMEVGERESRSVDLRRRCFRCAGWKQSYFRSQKFALPTPTPFLIPSIQSYARLASFVAVVEGGDSSLERQVYNPDVTPR